MPMLLEDLAEEMSASNRRVADRLDEEARSLDEMRRVMAAQKEEVRQRVIESARQATHVAVSQVSMSEWIWQYELEELCQRPTGDDAERLLRTLLSVFESNLRLAASARSLWEIARKWGAEPVPHEELERAEKQSLELAAEVRRALEHRANPWQPADKERLSKGLQLAREGKTVKADEARAWFRRTEG
jgi:hypothetical protein